MEFIDIAYVVTQPCFNCKYKDCAEVCPVDAFYVGQNMLYINPKECINCGACEPECPVNAIYEHDDVPEIWDDFKKLNLQMSLKLPNYVD